MEAAEIPMEVDNNHNVDKICIQPVVHRTQKVGRNSYLQNAIIETIVISDSDDSDHEKEAPPSKIVNKVTIIRDDSDGSNVSNNFLRQFKNDTSNADSDDSDHEKETPPSKIEHKVTIIRDDSDGSNVSNKFLRQFKNDASNAGGIGSDSATARSSRSDISLSNPKDEMSCSESEDTECNQSAVETAPVTKIQPICTRTRSSNRSKVISYSEDDLAQQRSTAYTEPHFSKGLSNDFPKTSTKPEFDVDPSKIPKNNDFKIFYSNYLFKSFCFLCGCSDKNLPAHYARKHPNTEVFISRVSPMMADRIREKKYDFVQCKTDIHGLCFFCEESKKMKKEEWMKHLLLHTAEQMFYCTKCKTSMPRSINHGRCTKATVQQVFQQQSTNDDLVGFICNTCNYIQFNESRMTQHLNTQHESFEEINNELYSRVVFVNISSA